MFSDLVRIPWRNIFLIEPVSIVWKLHLNWMASVVKEKPRRSFTPVNPEFA
jgi:hypothetical protein